MLQINKITFSNAIVNVHFPDLTEEKRRQRTKAVYKAAEALLKTRRKEGA